MLPTGTAAPMSITSSIFAVTLSVTTCPEKVLPCVPVSAGTMCKIFRREVGQSPTDFRKTLLGGM